jgi:serine/threonine protein kinase
MVKTRRNKKRNGKTRKIKGGSFIGYTVLSVDGYNGSIITPNIPFISDNFITKLGTEDDINNEINAYKVIRELNNSQYKYENMLIKVLCETPPISFKINRELFNAINKNKLDIKDEYTHALVMQKGENNLLRTIINKSNNGIFYYFTKMKKIIYSLYELNNQGYIHGDIKLNNILVFQDNFYLMDFGTFTDYPNFKTNALDNKNKLSTFLGHIPFESQYINENEVNIHDTEAEINKKEIEYEGRFNIIRTQYIDTLTPYLELYNNPDYNYFVNKFNKDINDTLQYRKDDIDEFHKKLFDSFDVFCIGFTLIQILNIYISTFSKEKQILFVPFYRFIIEKLFTYNLKERMRMGEFLGIFKKYIYL